MHKTKIWIGGVALLALLLVASLEATAGKGGNKGKPGGDGDPSPVVDLAFLAKPEDHPAVNAWGIYMVESDGGLARFDEEILGPYDHVHSYTHSHTRLSWSPAGDVLAVFGNSPHLTLRDPTTGQWTNVSVEEPGGRPIGPWTRQRDPADAILPYLQQRLIGVHDFAYAENAVHVVTGERLQSENVALYSPSGGAPVDLTDYRYVETATPGVYEKSGAVEPIYIPEQPEQLGVAWMIYRHTVDQVEYGIPWVRVIDEWRVLTLDLTAWPAVAVDSDDPVDLALLPLHFDASRNPRPVLNLSSDGRTAVLVEDGDLVLAPLDFGGATPEVLTGQATLVPVSPPRHFTFTPDAYQARLDDGATRILIGLEDRFGRRRAFVQNVDGTGLTQVDKDKSAGIEYAGDLCRATFRP